MLCSPWSLCFWPFCTPKSPCLAGVESLAKTVLPMQGAEIQSWLWNQIPHADHATAKDPECHNEDQRPCIPQLRPDPAK